MSFKKETPQLPRKTRYTNEELHIFDVQISKYYKDGVLDKKAMYVGEKIRNEKDETIAYPNGTDEHGNPKFLIPETEFEEKFSQWQYWKTRMEGGEKRRMFDWDEIAKSLQPKSAEEAGKKKPVITEEGKADYLRMVGQPWKEPGEIKNNT